MANKITKYMSEVSGKKVTNADLLNTIRESRSESYRADIPEMESLKPINHNNVPYANYKVHENEFFDVLVNRIGPVIVKALSFENPLGVFKTENFEYGETLEEIFVNITEEEQYDAKSDISPWKYADTDIRVFYHDLTDERLFTRTIDKQWTMKAFTSERAFDEFIDKMLTSLMSSDSLREFEKLKLLITNSLTDVVISKDGVTPPVVIRTPSTKFDINTSDFIVDFNKELIKRSNLFSVPSTTRFENAVGVPKDTPVSEQYLIMSADFSAELDSMLANAFNMDKATVLANKIILDDFPIFNGSGELNGAKPFAALVSKDTIILQDKLLEMTNLYNPRTLGYNYFLHHHQLISYSLLENAHIYYTMPNESDVYEEFVTSPNEAKLLKQVKEAKKLIEELEEYKNKSEEEKQRLDDEAKKELENKGKKVEKLDK